MSNAEARPDRQRRTPVRPMLNEQRDHHVHLCHALAHYIARELPLQVVRQFEIAEHGDERMHLTFIVPKEAFWAVSRELRPHDPTTARRARARR